MRPYDGRLEPLSTAPNDPLTNSMVRSSVASPMNGKACERFGLAMSLHLDRIEWMPSPPLAPDDGPIDIAHLRRMTLGDAALEREVLSMFSAQAARLVKALAALPPDASALAHTLKGSARAVGAFALGDAAAHLETLIKTGGNIEDALNELDDAVTDARDAIDAVLRQA
jgi:HPt (histidine-containing phosphotransfer) domain-containing protein